MKYEHRRLSRAEYRKLEDYLLENWEAIVKAKMTRGQVAQMASNAVGIGNVTEAQVYTAAQTLEKDFGHVECGPNVGRRELESIGLRVDLL